MGFHSELLAFNGEVGEAALGHWLPDEVHGNKEKTKNKNKQNKQKTAGKLTVKLNHYFLCPSGPDLFQALQI